MLCSFPYLENARCVRDIFDACSVNNEGLKCIQAFDVNSRLNVYENGLNEFCAENIQMHFELQSAGLLS